MTTSPTSPTLSVIVPVLADTTALAELHRAYRAALAASEADGIEFVYVLDGELAAARAALADLHAAGEPVRVLAFNQPFGEAAALSVGFRHARGTRLVTLPAWEQVAPADIAAVVARLDQADMVQGKRSGGRFGQGKLERAMRVLLNSPFGDLRCAVRALRREVADEIRIYGNQHRFLGLFALRHGFVVHEVEVGQGRDRPPSRSRMPVDLSLVLDAIAAFFLLRFVRRPFRFFGGFGLSVLALGGLATLWLVIDRLFLGVPLADRPALILSTLMIVLGMQIIAVGLIGEIVTFAYTKDMRDYRVETIIG